MKTHSFMRVLSSKFSQGMHPLFTFLVLLALLFFAAASRADLNITPLPPFLSETKGTPLVMLNMSRDHQLFYKAYNEYTDLNGDGTVETQYRHSYKYYGYFDNQRCYTYDTGSERYVPARKVNSTDAYCGGTGEWNGNFMNWATMTRMDVVRRILYGGMRSTDDSIASGASLTVLERAHLPTDAHAFAKYYTGNDVRKLTPFDPATTTFTVTTSTGTATVTAQQITMCNATYRNGAVQYSHEAIAAPTIRVVDGNFALWNANERWQCNWNDDKSATDGYRNGNDFLYSGIGASDVSPTRATHGLGRTGALQGSYTARIEVCKTGLTDGFTDDEEGRCKLYPLGNYKPIGLLQKYGERSEAAFGLLTGSYNKNISGGVLRKNIGFFTDEVDLDDGQFKPAANGIVKTMNALRIYGYDYADGTYINSDSCSFQQIGLVEGKCSSWGNPMGEMYLESLRYLAGQSASSDFETSGLKDAAIGLTSVAWTDPHATSTVASFGDRLCRKNSIINFNASVTSYDGNQWAKASDLANFDTTKLANYTNKIGDAEGISATGSKWAVGLTGGPATADNDKLCTYKSISSLANVSGVCPEAPTYAGSYLAAGAALYAHTNPIRSDFTIPAANTRAFKVDTYSVALATGTPKISIPVPNNTGTFVVIQPAYRLDKGTAGTGGGTLVDFKVVVQTPTYGKYLINWEDSEQGGDYDQDLWGTLEYKVVGSAAAGYKIQVSTYARFESTNQPQGFGYVIAGTSGNDGVHFHSGIENFNYTETVAISVTPTTHINATGGCSNCNVQDDKTTAEYAMRGVSGNALRDPFWYAAKYGGFDQDKVSATYTLGSTLPVASWDSKGTAGANGADGVPDTYFYAIDPAELEKSLNQVFATILKAGGAAPAAATSSRTAAGGYVYVSTHSIKSQTSDADADASGEFLRYSFQPNGQVALSPDWDGGAKLTIQDWSTGRKILSRSSAGPIAFRWASLDTIQQAALNKNGVGTVDTKGQDRLEWLRGNNTKETVAGGLRARPRTKLGSIVNSTPWFTGRPSAGYSASQYGGGYPSFRAANTATNAVFVAANDGMLHAFDGVNGNELFAYIPQSVYSKLPAISDKNYALNSTTANNVNTDGSVMAADIKVGNDWNTYLFGSMGRGAKGVYALNVTAPQNVSEASPSAVAKWEFTTASMPNNTPDMADLGFIVGRTNAKTNGQPYQVGYMANGKWAAIYGNGYNSTSGNAALFILFTDGPPSGTATWTAGTHYVKIATGATGNGPNNGLSSPTPVDTDNDGKIDVIYAGDLKGNVWKFNVSDANPSNWKLATTGNVPLYQAKTGVSGTSTLAAQPITTAIQPFPHPQGGYQLVVATGKFLESIDYPQVPVQFKNSVYGIYDRPGNVSTLTVGRTNLVEQAISFNSGSNIRSISKNTVSYTIKDGWFFDLPDSSEGVGFNPLYEDVRRVNLKSIAPESTSDGCRYDSIGYDMTLDPISGGPIAGLIPGATSETTGALGASTLNSFEYARGGVYPVGSGTGGGTPPVPPDCVAGSPNCVCNPASATECKTCEPGKPCCVSWDLASCSPNQCTFRTQSALGSGGIDTKERFGSCNDGRLTWREILRINN